jgi:Ca2+-binding EF-hand superfamily protein
MNSFIHSIFSILDHSGRITFEEFHATIKSLQVGIENDEDIKHIFQQFDTTNNGQIDLNEFLQQLRPTMNERRQKAALNLFDSIDVNKDGKWTISDLKVYFHFSKCGNGFLFQTKYAAQLKSLRKKSDQAVNQVSQF